MTDKRREKELEARRQIAQSDMIYDTQALKLPKEFIEENKETRAGPLVERPILIIFLLALAVLAVVAYFVSRQEAKPAQSQFLPSSNFSNLAKRASISS